jgi:hypothetical protein
MRAAPRGGITGVPKLAIWATAAVNSGRMDEYPPVLIARGKRCVVDEPGTLLFNLPRPKNDDGNTLHLYEVHADDAAFVAHMNAAPEVRYDGQSAGLAAEMSGVRAYLVERRGRLSRSTGLNKVGGVDRSRSTDLPRPARSGRVGGGFGLAPA